MIAAAGFAFRPDAPTPAARPIDAAKVKGDARFDLAFDAAKAVKSSLRDPDSLKWEFIGVNDEATVACLKYRAKNGFGGMSAATAVVVDRKASKSADDWQKYCSSRLHDETAAAG